MHYQYIDFHADNQLKIILNMTFKVVIIKNQQIYYTCNLRQDNSPSPEITF